MMRHGFAMKVKPQTATFETVNQTVDYNPVRSLHILHIDDVESVAEFYDQLPASFACLIAWDTSADEITSISHLADSLLRRGAAYVCAWGSHCELVHDVFDEALVAISLETGQLPAVMTTWHHEEPLDDVLFYLMYCSHLDDSYKPPMIANIAIVINNVQWTQRIREVFTDPRLLQS
jgi:hypothetical protein